MPYFYNKTPMRQWRRDLRRKSTRAEAIMWKELRSGKDNKQKFRRQYSVNGYVLDFYCPKSRLAIEVDGGYHDNRETKIYDLVRQEYIEDCGVKFLRFKNDEITNDLEFVLGKINEFLAASANQKNIKITKQ
jgi:very-short-patch-repair endonuclease